MMRSPASAGPGARQLGAGAAFAFPLMIGAIRAGAMGLYRDSPGPLTGAALGGCLLGDAATMPLATRLSQEMTASIVFFIALGWAGDRGAFARASSSLAPIS